MPRDHNAPEGAHCAEHPERPATFTCPRCGAYACASCWHPGAERCQACLSRDPTAAAPKLAWEQTDKPLLVRYFGTLASALSPFRSAPAFAHEDVGAALRFLLVSALPLALLTGVIPHTRTLMFAGDFAVHLVGHPSGFEIAIDVLRAMLAQVALSAVQLGCLLLPYASLARAYAPARKEAALRVMYYRFWLVPAAMLFVYLAIWMLPAPDPATAQGAPPPALFVVTSVQLLASVLLMIAMGATARLACGLGPLLSIVLVVVPFMLRVVVEPLATVGLERVLPTLESETAPPPQP
jgi:hypothetical protein